MSEYCDLFKVIAGRRSVRAFKPDSVDERDLNLILEATASAPSAGNLQAYNVVVVTDSAIRRELARACWGQDFVAEAPVVLVFLADPKRSARVYGRRGAGLYALQDATIACTFAMLAAHALGYGTCWIGAFDDSAVLRAVGASESGLIPVAVLPIGRPAETPRTTSRRRAKDVFRKDSFSESFPYTPVMPELRRPGM